MMRTLVRLLVALLALSGSTAVVAGLPSGISGTWYNPAQSGHGLSLDVLASDRAIAIWHVFDPDGQPLTLYIEAQLDGRRLTGRAYAPSGMRFGSFDPAALRLPVWGEVEISFASCDQAELSWRSSRAGFPDGRMPLVRLAQIDGSKCVLPPGNSLPVGPYVGEIEAAESYPRRNLEGFVDREGRLWGFDGSNGSTSSSVVIPGPVWVGNFVPRVIRIEPSEASATDIRTEVGVYEARAFWPFPCCDPTYTGGIWRVGTGGAAVGEVAGTGQRVGRQRWRPGAPAGSTLIAPISLAQLQGEFTLELRDQFFSLPRNVTIEADGSICVASLSGSSYGPCVLRGRLATPEGRFGLIEFSLEDASKPLLPGYRGRGWALEYASGRELILVGDNGAVGLLLVARER